MDKMNKRKKQKVRMPRWCSAAVPVAGTDFFSSLRPPLPATLSAQTGIDTARNTLASGANDSQTRDHERHHRTEIMSRVRDEVSLVSL